MGYLLTSLGNLPIEEDVDLYIFVINGGWSGGLYETLERNFTNIAKRIGPHAVIAKSFEESLLSEEICRKYLGRNYRELFQFLPAVLLTDAHPERLNDHSLRLLVPLRDVEKKFGDLEAFFRVLTDFAMNRNEEFLARFEDQGDMIESGLAIVELKPNFFGIGVNLNEVINRFRRNRHKTKG